jgi:hypothetical protein
MPDKFFYRPQERVTTLNFGARLENYLSHKRGFSTAEGLSGLFIEQLHHYPENGG